jgi:hypothetical protein
MGAGGCEKIGFIKFCVQNMDKQPTMPSNVCTICKKFNYRHAIKSQRLLILNRIPPHPQRTILSRDFHFFWYLGRFTTPIR